MYNFIGTNNIFNLKTYTLLVYFYFIFLYAKYMSIAIYLENFYQKFIKKRSQPIKFVICRKSREVMVYN